MIDCMRLENDELTASEAALRYSLIANGFKDDDVQFIAKCMGGRLRLSSLRYHLAAYGITDATIHSIVDTLRAMNRGG